VKMRILFYQPYNQTVVYIESIQEKFAQDGHDTFFISHAEHGDTHENLEKFGCVTFSFPIKRAGFMDYYYSRIKYLSNFCKKNKIDIVYSHFQEANLIAVLAQYFCKSKFVITRHHSDCGYLDNNWKERWGDKIINKLSKVYIAPSSLVYNQIVNIEGTEESKVRLINYGYNFENFEKPNEVAVEEIKQKFSATLLIVCAARFILEKRHDQLLDSVQELLNAGITDFKLVLLGKGPLESNIKERIVREELAEWVYLEGFKRNVMDYYKAASLIVHFSQSEASNSAIKEAAINDTTVAVCAEVGDFSDYVVNNVNGFLINKEDPGKDFVDIITKILTTNIDLESLGGKLHSDVIERFHIDNVIDDYRQINQTLTS
jgi:L-malate glycosyltransferase